MILHDIAFEGCSINHAESRRAEYEPSERVCSYWLSMKAVRIMTKGRLNRRATRGCTNKTRQGSELRGKRTFRNRGRSALLI